jgi:hypothetical protein
MEENEINENWSGESLWAMGHMGCHKLFCAFNVFCGGPQYGIRITIMSIVLWLPFCYT